MASVPIMTECTTAATSPTTTIQTVLSMATLVPPGISCEPKGSAEHSIK